MKSAVPGKIVDACGCFEEDDRRAVWLQALCEPPSAPHDAILRLLSLRTSPRLMRWVKNSRAWDSPLPIIILSHTPVLPANPPPHP